MTSCSSEKGILFLCIVDVDCLYYLLSVCDVRVYQFIVYYYLNIKNFFIVSYDFKF